MNETSTPLEIHSYRAFNDLNHACSHLSLVLNMSVSGGSLQAIVPGRRLSIYVCPRQTAGVATKLLLSRPHYYQRRV